VSGNSHPYCVRYHRHLFVCGVIHDSQALQCPRRGDSIEDKIDLPNFICSTRTDQWLSLADRDLLAPTTPDLQLFQRMKPLHALVGDELASLAASGRSSTPRSGDVAAPGRRYGPAARRCDPVVVDIARRSRSCRSRGDATFPWRRYGRKFQPSLAAPATSHTHRSCSDLLNN
jgi:hypothetical protein